MKLKIVLIGLAFCFAHTNAAIGLTKAGQDKTVVREFNERGGLPNFFSKVGKGDSIKVAYLGGSITAQNGWRILSLDWMKQRFPNAKFSEINAAIGGTGSDFGVFRLFDHVLKFNPDLVFVEFAVNDGGAPDAKITRSMEGIVRQIWQRNPKIDICFVYTISEPFLKTEQDGGLPNSAKVMEKVADFYKIPSVNFGFEVSKRVTNHQLIFKNASKELDGVKVFSPDGVHPYPETGHVIYNGVLTQSFEKMSSAKHQKPKNHKLSAPIAPDYFANTQMIDIAKANLSKNWQLLQVENQPQFSGFKNFLKTVGKADRSGETLTLHFKGQAVGVYDIMGPDAGRVIVEVDGQVKDTISRFDSYCTYRRMNYFLIDHLEDKDHIVVFRVGSDPFDKAAILARRGNVIKNPDDYKEFNWYVGKILVDGKLL